MWEKSLSEDHSQSSWHMTFIHVTFVMLILLYIANVIIIQGCAPFILIFGT